jgi:hypothetical protein
MYGFKNNPDNTSDIKTGSVDGHNIETRLDDDLKTGIRLHSVSAQL